MNHCNPVLTQCAVVCDPQAHAVKRSAAEGLVYVPPYDDPHTIAGQGTIGDEILRQVRERLDIATKIEDIILQCLYVCV